ncbi:acyl-CoA N-acyltransferase [Amylostereum chailletii]|nr:acyl-CoA N-acyltransferase [Amylostereum chailletii]
MPDGALKRQIYPLELNTVTGEPFLRLPPPYAHIIVTPPRDSDSTACLPILNDPGVYKWVLGAPLPHLEHHARAWSAHTKVNTDRAWAELVQAAKVPDGPLKITSECPVRIIREQKEDGEEVYVGDCGFFKYGFDEVTDREEQRRLEEENIARIPGDEAAVWSLGDYLAPSHQGQGIMTAVIRRLLDAWIVPRMGVRRVRACVFSGNAGSRRVFEKNGFTLWKTLENHVKVEARGIFQEETRTTYVLEWCP